MIDLSQPRRIHVVGVGGAGMSAIATVLAQMGHEVTGSDLKTSLNLDRLGGLGIATWVGHQPERVGEPDFLTISTAVPDDDEEVVAARRAGIPVCSRAETLAAICATQKTIAVAGTHGKTTTSSMLTLALVEAGFAPSFIIGGDVNEIGSGASFGARDTMVVEADASDGTFLRLPRVGALVTSVEPDHIEHYGSWEALADAFEQFVTETEGPTVVCCDDPDAARIATTHDATTYGTSAMADYRIVDAVSDRSSVSFRIEHDGDEFCKLELPVPGVHNARNAAGALVMASLLGASVDAGVAALSRFGGVARRFQFRGEVGGITLVDDYAHLPSEVAAALSAAKGGAWRRIVAVFQPHRYSRTQTLANTFGPCFADADVLLVTDIYPSGEEPRPGVTGRLVLEATEAALPNLETHWTPTRLEAVELLEQILQPGDLCITLGAGDLTLLPDEFTERARS